MLSLKKKKALNKEISESIALIMKYSNNRDKCFEVLNVDSTHGLKRVICDKLQVVEKVPRYLSQPRLDSKVEQVQLSIAGKLLKTKSVTIEKKNGALGITLEKADSVHPNEPVSSIVITDVRPEGAAALKGTIKRGDRLLAVNGVSLQGVSLKEAQALLKASSPVAVLTLEYDAKAQLLKSVDKFNRRKLEGIGKPDEQELEFSVNQDDDGVFMKCNSAKGDVYRLDLTNDDEIHAIRKQHTNISRNTISSTPTQWDFGSYASTKRYTQWRKEANVDDKENVKPYGEQALQGSIATTPRKQIIFPPTGRWLKDAKAQSQSAEKRVLECPNSADRVMRQVLTPQTDNWRTFISETNVFEHRNGPNSASSLHFYAESSPVLNQFIMRHGSGYPSRYENIEAAKKSLFINDD